MPLEEGKSREAFSKNVKTEMAAGKPQKQAVAIAYEEQRRSDDTAGAIAAVADQVAQIVAPAPEPLRAAGILFRTPDDEVLVLRRTDGSGWAFPGGGLEDGETPEEAARRELQEETGHTHTGDLRRWSRRIRDGVDFTTFLADVDETFTPALNDEHDLATWLPRAAALELPLHPGARTALALADMNELDVAKAMRDGELAGPIRYANLLLVAMRITGTGASYRSKHGEFVWRDPSLYLNPEFLERCNGLFVVLDHPPAPMSSEDFRERVIGSVFVPYIQGEEVWAIVKILDDAAAAMILTGQLSTSPAAVWRDEELGPKYRLEGGKPLLIEGKPRLLDHLAVVERGVWDKAGPPSGISTEGVAAMPDEQKKEETTAKADGETQSKSGVTLDTVLERLDGMCKRMDSMEAKMDADDEDDEDRSDADDDDEDREDADDDEDEREDADEEEGREDAAAEGLAKEREGNDLKRNDADGEKPREDVDGFMEGGKFHPIRNSSGYSNKKAGGSKGKKGRKGKAKRRGRRDSESYTDSALAAENAALRQRLDMIEKTMPKVLAEEDRKLFVAAQARAERVAQAFGRSDGAPRWLNGETLVQYRQRLAADFKSHSPTWKDVDVSNLTDAVLDVAEAAIYADAERVAREPVNIEGAPLREVREPDATGRTITKFVGDIGVAFAPFMLPARKVTGIRTKFA